MEKAHANEREEQFEIRVFVSSTFTDLKNHREAVRNAIRRLGAIDIAMENFGASEKRPLDECTRLVEQSDVYVGIFAHRYGFIPKGRRRSITELEYLAADIDHLIYLVSPEAPWDPSMIEHGKGEEKLASLKKRLIENHSCGWFRNPDELAAMVTADLARFAVRERRRRDLIPSVVLIPRGREARLLSKLRSTDQNQVEHAIWALAKSNNPSVVPALQRLILTAEPEVAVHSIRALGRSGQASAIAAISTGLTSLSSHVRYATVCELGEIALSGHTRWRGNFETPREHVLDVVGELAERAFDHSEGIGMVTEVVHSLAKIAGNVAEKAFIDLLESESTSPIVKVSVLNNAVWFWSGDEGVVTEYLPDRHLFNRFWNKARKIIKHWPESYRLSVLESCEENNLSSDIVKNALASLA